MDKIKLFFRNLSSINKFLLVCICLTTILLIINVLVTIKFTSQFSIKEQSGNARWVQVEDVMRTFEHRIDLMEERINTMDTKVTNMDR